jgi:hypothetical protein
MDDAQGAPSKFADEDEPAESPAGIARRFPDDRRHGGALGDRRQFRVDEKEASPALGAGLRLIGIRRG